MNTLVYYLNNNRDILLGFMYLIHGASIQGHQLLFFNCWGQ